MRVSAIIAEPLVTNEPLPANQVRERVLKLLDLVGLLEVIPAAEENQSSSRAGKPNDG